MALLYISSLPVEANYCIYSYPTDMFKKVTIGYYLNDKKLCKLNEDLIRRRLRGMKNRLFKGFLEKVESSADLRAISIEKEQYLANLAKTELESKTAKKNSKASNKSHKCSQHKTLAKEQSNPYLVDQSAKYLALPNNEEHQNYIQPNKLINPTPQSESNTAIDKSFEKIKGLYQILAKYPTVLPPTKKIRKIPDNIEQLNVLRSKALKGYKYQDPYSKHIENRIKHLSLEELSTFKV